MRRALAVVLLLVLTGCDVPATGPSTAPTGTETVTRASTGAVSFDTVTRRVEPVAEALCRAQAPHLDCNFLIRVERGRADVPTAYQTRDNQGRPLIVFSRALIADARNADELAFILGHEAAHHIAGHLDRSRAGAEYGAVLLGTLARAAGRSAAEVRAAARVGAAVAARSFSKEFEFEADALGARIALASGFDPLLGVEFFNRRPDPGDRFLGTHPPNGQRQARVRDEVRRLRSAGL